MCIRDRYSPGDLVWREDEVNAADSIHPFNWTGSYVVVESVNQLNNVLLRIDGRGSRPVEKGVNVAHNQACLVQVQWSSFNSGTSSRVLGHRPVRSPTCQVAH